MKAKILKFFVIIVSILIFVISVSSTVIAKITQTTRGSTETFGITLMHTSAYLKNENGTLNFGYRLDTRNAYRIYSGSQDYENTIICLNKDGKFPGEESATGNYQSLGLAEETTLNEAYNSIDTTKANAIMWIIRNAVLPEDSGTVRDIKLEKIFKGLIDENAETVNAITISDIKEILTEDDIVFAYQCAVWEYTNGDIQNKVLQGNNTGNDSDWDGLAGNDRWGFEGRKGTYIKTMIDYYINNAGSEDIIPNSSTDKVTPKITKPTITRYEVAGNKIFIGPFKIEPSETGKSTIDYTVNFTFKDTNGTVLPITMGNTGYYLTTSATTSTSTLQQTKTALEGREFYFAFPNNTRVRTVDINLEGETKSDTEGTVWVAGEQNQPLLSIERTETPVNVSDSYTFTEPVYDVALRKYIVSVYRKNGNSWNKVYDGEQNGRKPVATDMAGTNPFNQRNYAHQKEPVDVKVGDRVVYGINLYNEMDTTVRITQIQDHLPPSGLKFITESSSLADSEAVNGLCTKSESHIIYSGSTNIPYICELEGYEAAETIKIEFEVEASAAGKIVTNIAEITEKADKAGNPLTKDYDSYPNNKTLPTTETEWQNYTGNNNKPQLNDEDYYYKGTEDDDDFEKIRVTVEDSQYTLKIIKTDTDTNEKLSGATFTAKVNGANKGVTESSTDGEYNLETIAVTGEGTDNIVITETTAPAGYKKLVDTITINVVKTQSGGTYEVTASLAGENNNIVNLSQTGTEITITVKNKKKIMDMALRKYITKTGGADVTNTRVPEIDESTLASGTTATYKHRKDPILVKTNDEIIYNITVYNEGEVKGRVTKIIDQLPRGIEYVSVEGNIYERSYDRNTNIVTLTRKSTNTTNLDAYISGDPKSETVQIKCKITALPTASEQIFTNVAWIAEEINGETNEKIINETGKDRDSEPGTAPSVDQDNMANYTGNNNKSQLDDATYYYKGQQDDDDFEKVKLNPATGAYNIKIVKIDTDTNEKLSGATFSGTVNGTSKTITESSTKGEYSLGTINITAEGTDTIVITENSAPTGYKKLVDTITINVVKTQSGGTYEVTASLVGGNNNIVNLSQTGTEITITVKNKKKIMDMALRKYITQTGGANVINTRVPDIDESTLASGTTATYKHRKDPILVKTNDEIIYNITVYNEGEVKGRVTKIIDQLPRGIEYVSVEGNIYEGSYDRNTNIVTLTRKSTNTTNLDEYTSGNPKSETVTIKCKITALPTASEQIFTNVAWIAEEVNGETNETIINETGKDRDSEPGTAPSVDQDNMANYTGNNNKPQLDDATYYYKGQQDDDDFEKVKLNPATGKYNVKLIKVDSQDNTKKLSGAKFEVTLPGQSVEELTTNGDGQIETGDVNITETGKDTIKIKETQAPSGYENLIDEIEIEITKVQNGEKYEASQALLKTPNEYASINSEGNTIIITIQNRKKKYDLALKKYITKIEGKEVTPRLVLEDIDVSELQNGGHDAEYPMDKSVLKVKTGDRITYTIRIFNEGEIDGYAELVKDDIPEGLEFITDSEINRTYRWKVENGEVVTDYLSKEVNPDKQIKAFNKETGELDSEYVQIEFRMTSKVANKVIKNIAQIKEDDGEDGDSIPDNDNPEEDDEDYDNIVPLPYDLALKKFITGVTDTNGTKKKRAPEQERYMEVEDVSALVARNGNKADAKYKYNKTPVQVAKGDYVTYTIRIYNEGLQDGKALEIRDTIPEGLEFVGYTKNGNAYSSGSRVNYNYGWKMYDANGNETTDTSKAREIRTEYLKDTVIPAFDSTKVNTENKGLSYEDVQVEFRVVTDEMKELINIAEITKDDGDDDDSTPDNDEPKEDDQDYDVVIPGKFDLSLRKFITKIDRVAVTDRVPKVNTTKLDSEEDTTAKYEHTKEPKVVVKGNIVTYTIRVYNEGTINGYVEEIKDDLPEGITFLPEHETNQEYGWKMYDSEGKETTEVSKATNIRTTYAARESETGKLLKAYDKETMKEPDHIDVKAAFEVTQDNATAKNKVIINTAEISDDADEYGNEVEDRDSIPDDDTYPEDDIDKEYLILKYFDLSLLKYVSKVIVTEDGVTKETETNYNGMENPEPIVKVELNKKKLARTEVKYVYTIKITNEGEIEGYAKEIKDRIPDGLAFFEEDNTEYNWKVETDGIVTTDYLKDTLLQPGESATVPIVLRWRNAETNLGQKINVAEISKDENPYGAPDIDSKPNNNKEGEDDQDEAIVLLSLNTGSAPQIYFVIGIVVVAIMGTGIYAIKKYVL